MYITVRMQELVKQLEGPEHHIQETVHKELSMMTLRCFTYPSIDMRVEGFTRAVHLVV
jgi:hypothetical protein